MLYRNVDKDLIQAHRIKYHAKADIPITPDDATLLKNGVLVKMAPSKKKTSTSAEGSDLTGNPPASPKGNQTIRLRTGFDRFPSPFDSEPVA